MEGFKKSSKMQCFKEGGTVKYKSRHSEKREMSEDVAQDKKIIKKAFSMHDAQEHKGEHTNLSKLKKGGRAKKDCGTVKKYKTGGSVENAYGAKKSDKDIKDIANAKRQKPAMLCGGKSVRKMAAGGPSFETDPAAAQAALDTKDNIATRNMIMDPARKAKKYLMDKLSGLSPMNAAVSNVGASVDQMGNATGAMPANPVPGQKKGGKVAKK